MACLVTSGEIDAAIRAALGDEGFTVSESRANGETGADLLAKLGSEEWYIESIGYNAVPSQRSYDFYTSFFRAISRLKDGASRIAIALPAAFGRGLHQRARHYGEGWVRIGAAFPEL